MGGQVDLGIPGLGPATPLARGGFAQVYRAEQLGLHRTVAVKVLFAPPADRTSFVRFERECQALGAVSGHPNIVVVHDRGYTADGRPYITMEHRAGGSLADQLAAHGPMPADRVVDIGIKVCDALAVAHSAGVIHRDVKPANILLSAQGEPALADFGISRIEGGQKTTSGQFTASAAHAAREVLSGEEPTIQSDLYSVGSTLYQLAVGSTPFEDPADATIWQLLNRVLSQPAPDPARHGVRPELAAVLRRALSHDREERHQSAGELAADLRAVAGGSTTVPFGATTVAAEIATVRGRRRWPVVTALAVAGFAVLAVAGLAVATAAGVDLGLRASTAEPAGLELGQASIGPLIAGTPYALTVRRAPAGAMFQLVVDGEAIGPVSANVPIYRPDAGRHTVAIAITAGDTTETTEPVEVYAVGDPPVPGYRVNLASVVAEPENWRRALDEFDDLVGEGHDDLELYPSTEREYWNFYIDGFGDDSDAAWAYCDRFGLGTDDCFAARIRGDDAGDVEAQPATQDSEAGTDP